MRKIYLLILLGITACDSMLDVDPTSQYSADTFWVDEETYSAGLTGCYNALYDAQLFFNGETDMITPNSISYDDRNGTRAVALDEALTTNALFLTYWDVAYEGIGRANTFLDQIDHADFDESSIDQMKGEALFLRALFYSYLADYFGDCPLILGTPDLESQGLLARTPKEEVVAQIVADLDSAAALLPTTYSSSDIGRATKGAALALKARTLLYNEEWTAAAEAAEAVMDLETYELFDDYRGLFMSENENNSEVIFDIQYESPNFMHRFDYVAYNLKRPAPLKSLVDAYLMTDGLSIDESPLYDPDQPYENRDPRLHQTIYMVGYMYNGAIVTDDRVNVSGYGQKKYTDYPDDETVTINDNNSVVNFIVLRYAEVLLTYAEALNEANGPSDEVYAALNTIRQRTSVEMPDIETGLSQEQMRAAIRLERRIEMAGEGLYYTDIRRWGTIEDLNNGPVYDASGNVLETRAFIPERDYLWAIPSTEIQLDPNLEQNPGW